MHPNAATLSEQLGSGFESKFAEVNGTRLHYVRGGSGPAIILLHGFPEDWYEFRLVMPRLAKTFTVLAVDLRGVGESAPSATGYEAANLAEDVHQLVVSLGLEHVYVFGHDIGGMVAYAFARRYPLSARGVMILDVAFPGLDPWQDILGHPAFWHVRFHQTGLPEKLVSGRQAEYFRYFLRQFSEAEWVTMRTRTAIPITCGRRLILIVLFRQTKSSSPRSAAIRTCRSSSAPANTTLSRSSCRVLPRQCGHTGARI
jgi:pimeloyl-ACP methyl ester carboxylesterase